MMARIDKYFIAELQEIGYDFDFKKLCDIYRASRERPDYIKNKNKKAKLFSMYNSSSI